MVDSGLLLGRDRELAALREFIAAGIDEGAALLIVGEPGIGKSALLAAARSAAHDAGCTVLHSAGIESETHLPFGGIHQALAPLMRHLPALPDTQRVALATAFGLIEGANPDLFLIAEATVALVAAQRRERPVVVIIDDVHWLDPQSHQILTFVAHRAAATGIGVIGASRPDHGGPFIEAGFPRVTVSGVDDATAETLLQVHVGGLSTANLNRIRREAQGNPLALLELPRSWGDGPPTDQHPLAVSARLERAFAGRIAQLPNRTRDTLLIAAIGSSSNRAEILAALPVFGTAPSSNDPFHAAVAAGLITDEAADIRFRHPLVRSAVVQLETSTRRQAAHAALAEVLEADSYRRAWHRAWSIVGPDDDVADALAATVPDSLRRGAVMSAVSSLERAAQLTSSSRSRGARLLEAAGHAFGIGRADVVGRLLREAAQVDLADLDQLRSTWLTEALNDDISADSALVRHLCDCARRADRLGDAGLALDLLFAAGLRCWWAESGPDDRAEIIGLLAGLTGVDDDPRRVAAIAITEPVLRAAEVLSALESVALAEISDGDSLRVYGMAAYAVGDLVQATDLLDRAEASFRQAGRLGGLPVVLALQLHIRLDLGDWSGAVLASEDVATTAKETGQALFAENNVLVEARHLALRGEWRAALASMAPAEAEAARLHINDRICFGYQARGVALLSADRPDEAYACLSRQFDPADAGYHLRESFAGVALLAEAAVACGRQEQARSIIQALEAVRVITPAPLLEVNLLYARAVLAADEDQDEFYQSALAHDLSRWPWPRARLNLAYGQWLARAGLRSQARAQLQAAHDQFERIGAARWRSSASSALQALDDAGPGTERVASTRAPNLLGRDGELDILRRLVRGIEDEGASVLLRGPAGVGKSSLLRAAATIAEETGALVLETSGIESEASLPFAGLQALLLPLLAQSDSLPPVQQRALSTAFGAGSGPPPELFLTALAALTLIVDAAASQPIVLLIDDVQWLDAPTDQVLAFVSRRLHNDPVIMISTLRDGHAAALGSADASEITVPGLDERTSRELLAIVAGDLTADDQRAVLGHARGNPLALVELPTVWRSAEAAGLTIESTTIALTTRLEQAFAARITELPAITRDALLITAVNAEENLAEVLAATARLAGGPVTTEILEPAAAARLLSFDETGVRFRHPLMRSGVLHSESVARRQAAHAAMSAVLVFEPTRQVWHQAQAVDGPDDEVATRLDTSHVESIRRGSVLSAIAALERAAQLTSSPGPRARRLLLAAQHAFGLGRADLVTRLVDAAEIIDLTELDQARAEWLRELFSEGKLGDSARVRELCSLAVHSAASGEVDLALDLLGSAALRCWWAVGDAADRDHVATVAAGLSVAADDARCIAAVAVADPLARVPQTRQRLEQNPATGLSDAVQLCEFGKAARAIGADADAADYFDGAESRLRERGQLGLLSHVLAVQAAVFLDLGDWRRAGQSLEEGRQLSKETGQSTWRTGADVVEAVYFGLSGRADQALARATEVEAACAGEVAGDFLSLVQLARGAAYLSTQQPAAAYAALAPIFDPLAPCHHPREQLSAVMFLVEAAVGCGAEGAAGIVVEDLERLAENAPSPILGIHLLYARAVLASDDDAEALFESALAQDLTRWPWPRARLELAYGERLRRRRRLSESRTPLRSALSTFEVIGAPEWARQARAGLRAAGERTSVAPTLTATAALSAQEMQIARLAAGGRSNREIGQQLYLSPRTVGSHLYRIFPKLGITSRAQLATRMADS